MVSKNGTHVSLLDQIVDDEILKENESESESEKQKDNNNFKVTQEQDGATYSIQYDIYEQM